MPAIYYCKYTQSVLPYTYEYTRKINKVKRTNWIKLENVCSVFWHSLPHGTGLVYGKAEYAGLFAAAYDLQD